MAIRTIYTRGTPGDSAILNSRMFPYGHSVADWATKKVAPVESAAPNTGLFAWSLNDVWGLDWVRFPSDTQPANWSTGIDEWKLPVRENTCFIQDGFDSISDGANITNSVAPVSR